MANTPPTPSISLSAPSMANTPPTPSTSLSALSVVRGPRVAGGIMALFNGGCFSTAKLVYTHHNAGLNTLK